MEEIEVSSDGKQACAEGANRLDRVGEREAAVNDNNETSNLVHTPTIVDGVRSRGGGVI